MSISLPSKRVAVVDAPEVSQFSANFVYNFFTPDEELNDSGTTPPDFIEKRPAEGFDTSFIDSKNFNRFTPRYVKFSWKANPAGNKPEIGRRVSIATNLSKIHNEQSFVTENYTNIVFQDNSQNDKIAYFIRRAIEETREDQNPNARTESPLDVVKFLHRNTTENIRGNFLTNGFINLQKNGVQFLDKPSQDQITQTVLNKIKNVRTRTQLNNKLLASLLRTTSQNPINIFDDETAKILPEAERIQQKAAAQEASSTITSAEYDFDIVDIVDYRVIDPNAFDSTVQVVGYIIDKTEYTENGPVVREPIVVESPNAGTSVDLKIKYEGRYGYSIRSVVYVEVSAEDEDTNSIIAVSFLVSSQNSSEIIIDCRETVAPPSVADFQIDWDYQKDAPRLSWSFPVNSQRDIKYFQVFKRATISEPYQLLKMYDFNDSLTPNQLNETVDPILIEKQQSPKAFYIDYTFKREEKALYTICTLDAHGFTSNYSMQFEISFDKFKNKLVKKLISLSGAPKAYPNFFLQRDTFVDSIRTSGAKSLRVIFNPEYLKVTDNNSNDLRLLKTGTGSVYRLQMINVDLQQQQVININLLDKRPASKKDS
ncbi:MAG: hypothetical protein WC761_00700 [Candidatus Paceibacterota bacterium]|jgi:hypothetical protein